jgi:hypothetical protein
MRALTKNFSAILLLVALFIVTASVYAQIPPPPPGGGHGGSGNQEGGGAPVGEGIFILTALGATYATKKWRAIIKQKV